MTHTQENTLVRMNRNELTGLAIAYMQELSLAELRSLVGTFADTHIANEKPERKPSTRKSATKKAANGKRTPKVYELNGKQFKLRKGAWNTDAYRAELEKLAKSRRKADKELVIRKDDGSLKAASPAAVYARLGWLEEVTE